MNMENSLEEDQFLKQRLPSRLSSLREIINQDAIKEEFSVSLLFSEKNVSEQCKKVDSGELTYDTINAGYSIPMVSILDMNDNHIEPLTIEVGSKYTYMNILINKKDQREAVTFNVKFICSRWQYHDLLRTSFANAIEKLNRKVYNI